MNKLFKQLVPALLGAAAMGCSTPAEEVTQEEQIKVQQFSDEQLAFQQMIREQEASQIEAFKANQINKSSIKINAAIDAIEAAKQELATFKSEKNAKKREVLVAAKKLIDSEKKKLAGNSFQDQYWAYVEEGSVLAANQPVVTAEKSKLNPANWFSQEEEPQMTEEEREMAEFTAEEYAIAIRINKENQDKSWAAYNAMKEIVISNAKAVKDQCDKELADIDKEISAAHEAAMTKIAAQKKVIKFEEEMIEYYSTPAEQEVAVATEEVPAEEAEMTEEVEAASAE